MDKLSTVIFKMKQKFDNNKTKRLADALEYKDYKNKSLERELKEKDDKIFNLIQENAILDEHIKYVNEDTSKVEKNERKRLLNQIIDLQEYKESSLYMEKIMANALERTTKERNIYKEAISRIGDKYNISHVEIVNIIGDIKSEKDSFTELD